MFDQLSQNLGQVFRKITGRANLTESNMSDALKEVRRALLEADVNYKVVKDFIHKVSQEAKGQNVLRKLQPGQQLIKIVHDELVVLLGEKAAELNLTGKPAIIMMCGLHGGGKTTTTGKLGKLLKEKYKKKVLLAACDLHRPAAITQLQVLGKDLGIEVYAEEDNKNVIEVASNARKRAVEMGADVLILDTAGRLQIDEVLVQELKEVRDLVQPQEVLLIADSALGQEAVSVATHFNEALSITGVILTKLDGDARGGAALSIRQVCGAPIKFVGVGEQAKDLEVFHPDRLAGRILGMGDVVSLVEKVSAEVKQEDADKMAEKLRKNSFTLEDFLAQMQMIQKMGGILPLLKMIPGMGDIAKMIPEDDRLFKRIGAMITSMTPKERQTPDLIGPKRSARIAKGCGCSQEEVLQLVKQFKEMRRLIGDMGKKGLFNGMGGGLGGLAGLNSLGGLGGASMNGLGGLSNLLRQPGQMHGGGKNKKKF